MQSGRELTEPLDVIEAICQRAAAVTGDVRAVVEHEVSRVAPLAGDAERERLITRAVARLDGLDALDEYLCDASVDEVMVNRASEVWIDAAGTLQHVADLPVGTAEVVLERVLAPLGRRLDRTSPIVDARLSDGSRVCAVVQPVAVDGTTISIRRHREHTVPPVRFTSPVVVDLLEDLIARRCNIVVSGATSSGKTTLLAGLLALADHGDRVVLIEDTAELPSAHGHLVRLESRAGTVDGTAEVSLDHLVRTALRLRPDRLVVGEIRGGEVLALMQALNTGHDGSLSTCHANSALDALGRLETLVMQAAPTWPLRAIRRQIERSVDIVIHVGRASDGSRHITEIVEVEVSDDAPRVRQLAVDGVVVGQPNRSRA